MGEILILTFPMALKQHPLLGAVLLLFGALGVWYSLAVPPFETPDEPFHYAFARHLAQGNSLPVQRPDEEGPWAQEGSQAPLYYLIAGALTSAIDQSDYEMLATRNPRANIGDPLYPGNKNFMLYSAAPHSLTGANLALHVGRWFSLLLGAITLFFTYATARLALPDHPPLAILSALVVALIPQFLFLSASFSNDNMIVTASSATLYWLARLLVHSRTRPIRPAEWLVLGILLGVAALSKLHGLGLFGLAALCGLWITWRRRDWWLPLRALLPVALPALLIAGWWYWRNFTLYGDWLGIQHLLEINGQRQDALRWGNLGGELRGLRYSFWGLFGWFNLPLPTWLYTIFDGLTLLALVGLVGRLAWPRGKRSRSGNSLNDVLLLLATWTLLSLCLLAYWITQATGSQGRLLFPALSSLAILFVWGMDGWRQLFTRWRGWPFKQQRLQQVQWGALLGFMGGCSLYVLLFLLPAAYRAPAPVAAIPESAQRVNITYGDSARQQAQLQLLALEVENGHFTPGAVVPITLYLSAAKPVAEDYQLFIQLLDEHGEPIANLTTHPGWGRNPTSLWTAGAIYADSYLVRIEQQIDADSPLLARVYTGFITPSTNDADLRPMTAHDASGQEITPLLANVAIRPWHAPDLAALDAAAQAAGQVSQSVSARFGNAIELTAFALADPINPHSDALPLTLLWRATGSPAVDYTAYVHLRTTSGDHIAGFDQPPSPRFPTSFWQPGDAVVSRLALTLPPTPPGRYELWLGLYESASQGAMRLPVHQADGKTVANGELLLSTVEIE